MQRNSKQISWSSTTKVSKDQMWPNPIVLIELLVQQYNNLCNKQSWILSYRTDPSFPFRWLFPGCPPSSNFLNELPLHSEYSGPDLGLFSLNFFILNLILHRNLSFEHITILYFILVSDIYFFPPPLASDI